MLRADGSTLTTTTTYDYDSDTPSAGWSGYCEGGVVTHSHASISSTASGFATYTTDTVNDYVWTNTPLQHTITVTKNNDVTNKTVTSFEYDTGDRLTYVDVEDSTNRHVKYVENAAGEIVSRAEFSSQSGAANNPTEFYYYLNNQQIGDIGNNGPSQTDYAADIAARAAPPSHTSGANFDADYQPIGPNTPSQTTQTYTVREGDTLQGIAAQLWGDSSLWYLLADSNGLNGTEALPAGMNLTIPDKVANFHNTASTFQAYDPSKALGNVQPNESLAPPPPAQHHNGGACGSSPGYTPISSGCALDKQNITGTFLASTAREHAHAQDGSGGGRRGAASRNAAGQPAAADLLR